MIELINQNLKLRGYRASDCERVAELCNNKKIWDNLRDCIPFPYTRKDAAEYIEFCQNENPQTTFAIEFKGDFVGSIGLVKQTDIYSLTAELGYWIGEPYWGQGIATKAVNLIVDYGFIHLNLERIFSGIFDFNKASQRVLEKAGFKMDCVFENAVFKNGKICNEYRYSKIKKHITSPAELMEAVNSFRTSRLILTAFELRIFDQLSGKSLPSADVASALGTDWRATDRLLNAVSGTGLLIKEEGAFSNSAFAEKFLVSNSSSFMGGLDHSVALWKTWSTLTGAVKAGKSLQEADKDEINERGENWLDSFIAAMHARGVAQGKELASLLDLSEMHKTLDVGGGSGAFTFAFIEKNPSIKGVILDLPNVVPITRKYIERAGCEDKVTTLEGNYLLDDFGSGFDLVLMSAIIHINNPEENSLLIRKGSDALKTGGRLIIMDHVMNEERTQPFIGALFALNMLVGTKHGDTYTEQEYRGWMEDAGLKDITLTKAESGMQFMTGRKG